MAIDRFRQLHQLAHLFGVMTSYHDVTGHLRLAEPQSILAVLQILGAPVEKLADVPGALRECRQQKWRRYCEPVTVAWEGEPAFVELSLPVDKADNSIECHLRLEDGEVRRWTCDLSRLPVAQVAVVEGTGYVIKRLALPPELPRGYHRLHFDLTYGSGETVVIAAPRQAYTLPSGAPWGMFLPLYALHSKRSWGAGDLGDLEKLLRWTRDLGGSMVGTLPLLAAFLDEPFDPSPYAPASRLFWNEFYLDVTVIPELKRCSTTQQLLGSPEFQREIASLRAAPVVHYRRLMALKRRVLEHLARHCFAENSQRRAALYRWMEAHPVARDYARFRAAVERQRTGWPAWPSRMRNGTIQQGDYDPEAERYHLYVQWVAQEQFEALSAKFRDHGPWLYLDLPLGVHRAGYDVWRERDAFALEANSGAPPDAFFSGGQNWGIPPLHPERIREQGYRYFIACLRHVLQHAGILRIDHVMWLHRLFWIPRGLTAREGVYVRYRADELYAILTLESHRYRTAVVGEDLGTVPHCVRETMERHRIYRMYVLPFEFHEGLSPIPVNSLACLNTHDMPPFKTSWQQEQRKERAKLTGLLFRQGLLNELTVDAKPVLRALLAHLASSRARMLLVNLEDLWLETFPQNIPGSGEEYPNWRRKARYSFEEFSRMPEVLEILFEINSLRKRVE